jgi:hypothetical protein
MMFGANLEFATRNIAEECSVCLEDETRFVKNLQCTHYFCLKCFRRLHSIVLPTVDMGQLVNLASSSDISPEEIDSDEMDADGDKIQNCPLCRRECVPAWNSGAQKEGARG